jgi:hypothetical protein
MKMSRYHPAMIIPFICMNLASGVHAQSQTPKEAPMTTHSTGAFDVKMIPQEDKSTEGVSRILIDKQYHGDLEGAAKGQMLTNGVDANGSGVYVAMEKFSGTLHGRTGTFMLHHTGVMMRSKPQLTITVVPDSGTGDLAGIAGTMTINIASGGKHSYDFEYTLPNKN